MKLQEKCYGPTEKAACHLHLGFSSKTAVMVYSTCLTETLFTAMQTLGATQLLTLAKSIHLSSAHRTLFGN